MNSEQQDIFSELPKTSAGLSKAKIIFFACLFISVLFLIYGSRYWTQSLDIQEISVTGNKYYSKKKIIDKVYTQILSHTLSDINFGYIKDKILEDPFVEDVDFITTYPRKVIISVKPKNLLAHGRTSEGNSFYLTEKGEMIKRGDVRLAYSLPEVDFDKIGKNKSKRNLVEISDFLKNYYHSAEKEIKAERIWKDKNGICFLTKGKIVVRIGNLTNIDDKFIKFKVYIKNYLAKAEIIPDYIDLRWENQVVTN